MAPQRRVCAYLHIFFSHKCFARRSKAHTIFSDQDGNIVLSFTISQPGHRVHKAIASTANLWRSG